MAEKDFAGKNGFIWWMGFVEDRKDPYKLGRVRVRCVGWHPDNKMELPTDMLPWATTTFPVNNTNPYAPKEGDMCFWILFRWRERTRTSSFRCVSQYSSKEIKSTGSI